MAQKSGTSMAQKSVDELVAEYQKMVQTGRSLAPFAADNLEHWLGNTGAKRLVSATHFQNDSNILAHLKNTHRAIFLSKNDPNKGVLPRLRINLRPANYSMTWEDSSYAKIFTEMYYALGGFTVRSRVDVSVAAVSNQPKTFRVTFLSWKSQVYDNYNWDHGKSVYIPGWGKIDDKEALRVESAGKAKSYQIESQWWQVINPEIIASERVVVV
jgi:hypothetical protein